MAQNQISDMKPLHVVGQRLNRVDGWEKVTGKARYSTDITLPGMLYAAVVRSPHPHARVLRVDASQAEALYGVEAVVHCLGGDPTAPFNWANDMVQSPPEFSAERDQHIFERIVRYVGDEVAAVAAISSEIAEQAAALIQVEYELLPFLISAEEAAAPSAPPLHPEINPSGNRIGGEIHHQTGDAEQAFLACDAVVEAEYYVPIQKHMQLETQNALAAWEGDGKLTVWSATQSPALVQRMLAEIFRLPMSRVRVKNGGYVGGSFGVRIGCGAKSEVIAVLLALKTGQPVKVCYSRHEDCIASETRHGGTVKMKLGLMKNGTFLALQARFLLAGGAYALSSGGVTGAVCGRAGTVYRFPNKDISASAYYTNTTPCGAQRGYGAPQPYFALEQTVSRAAEAIGMDPVELRLKNIIRPGDDWGNPYPCRTTGLDACIRLGAERIGWKDLPRLQAANEGRRFRRGLGVACGNHVSSGYPFQIDHSNVFLALQPDGSVQVATGMMEMGPGLKTALCQIAAEAVGTRPELVSCTMGDTETACYDAGAQASRSVYTTGHAVMNAGKALKADILEFAGERLSMDAGQLDLCGGALCDRNDKPLSTLAELAKQLDGACRQLSRIGKYTSYNACSWHAHFADVTVDTWTGAVRVNRVVAVHDVGKAINPTLVEGQIEGGVSMGIGYALTEEMQYDSQGRQIQDSHHKYILPMSLDVGEIEAHIVETDEPSGPYGAKGVAENPVGAVPPAVAHAIRNAAGIWMTRAPMTPERVLQALGEAGLSPFSKDFKA